MDVLIAVLQILCQKLFYIHIAACAKFNKNPKPVALFRITVSVHMLDITNCISNLEFSTYIAKTG